MPIDQTLAAGLQPIQIAPPDDANRINKLGALMRMQGLQSENQLSQFKLQSAQQDQQRANALAAYLSDPTHDLNTVEGQRGALALGGDKEVRNLQQARTAQTQGQAASEELFTKRLANAKQVLQTLPPEQLPQFMAGVLHDDVLGQQFTKLMPAENWVAHAIDASRDPNKAAEWVRGFTLTPAEELTRAHNASMEGFRKQEIGLQLDKLNQPPDEIRAAKAYVDMTPEEQAAYQKMHPDKSAGQIEVTPDTVEYLAQTVAQGGQPNFGFGNKAAELRSKVYARAAEIAKEAGGGDIGAGAAKVIEAGQDKKTQQQTLNAFNKGKQGDAVRFLNVAVDHLDVLRKAADALKNGDTQAFNKVAQEYAKQTGESAPTNFDAVKQFVGNELFKAAAGGVGALADREEIAAQIAKSRSPEQLAGVMDNYTRLMAGQLRGLEQQYKSGTGRNDFHTRLSPGTARALNGGLTPDNTPAQTPTGASVSNW